MAENESPRVRLVTNYGDIVIELNAAKAPKTVANFLAYVENGHYENCLFHRVIDGFMIQTGGFEPGMQPKSAGKPIDNEADNGLANATGTVAMARTSDPHSASAQFFINTNDNDFLNFSAPTRDGWGYCVFGRVSEGMDVVTRIEEVATTTRSGHQNVPTDDVIIERAEVVTG